MKRGRHQRLLSCLSPATEPHQPQVSLLGRILSASVGTLATTLLVTPLDVVKTRLQSQSLHTEAASTVERFRRSCSSTMSMVARAASLDGLGRTHTHAHGGGRVAEFGRANSCTAHATGGVGYMPRQGIIQGTCAQCLRQCHATARVAVASAGSPVGRAVAEVTPLVGPLRAPAMAALRESARAPSTTLSTFIHLVRVEGAASLYSGLSPTLLMAVPSTALYYSLYDSLRVDLAFTGDTGAPLLAGMSARVAAVTLISPLELMRTKMQAKGYKHTMVSGMRHEIATAGVRSLWRGLAPTLWRDVPFSGSYWLTYETLRKALVPHAGAGQELTGSQEFAASFAAGAGAGALAATITTPFDVVKTQVQVSMHKRGSVRSPSIPGVMRAIVQARGWRGMFAGLVPRVAKVAPACAIMISSYELGKTFLAQHSSSGSAKAFAEAE